MSEKQVLRARMRGELSRIPLEDRLRAGAHIEEAVWTLPAIKSARAILLYASLPSEVPTDLIAEEARRRGISVVYPRCLPEGRMTLHSVHDPETLVGGRFGIREPPADCPLIEVGTIDVAFVPGLAYDRSGQRLGRGAGYYDRILADPAWGALRCGLFFSVQEVPILPADPWDVPLDVIVNERETIVTSAVP